MATGLAYLVTQVLHDLYVKGLEAVAVWADEVEAAVNPIVDDVLPVETTFVAKVS